MGERFNFHVLMLMMYLRKKKFSTRKTNQSNDIPVQILKQNIDIFSKDISKDSFDVNEGKFPNIFKLANITPAFKRREGYKESYSPMSISACGC